MIDSYKVFLGEKGKAKKTINSYVRDLNIFFRDLNIRSGDFVTESDIRRWLDYSLRPEAGKGLAVSTISRRLNALRSFYNWAYSTGLVRTNPTIDIHDIKTADEEQEKIVWLTESEFEDLLHRMREKPVKSKGVNPEEKYRRDRMLVYLLAYAGLRVEEASNLKITDIDLDLKKIRILGKGNKIRTNPIPNLLYHEIIDWLKFRSERAKIKKFLHDSPFFFYSQRSSKLSIRGIQSIIESYSLPTKHLTPHMFRHTFCKWMLKATKNDVEKVRRMAGHKSIVTTMRYLKVTYSDLAEAVESLPKIVG